MLIHASVTVSGERLALIACEARMRRLLSAEFLKGEATERHGEEVLRYDLKVEGGIPFPAFADASREFPQVRFVVEWVNVAAGQRGSATIVDGRVVTQEADPIAVTESSEHPIYVSVAEDGVLRLALTVLRAGREEWRGYVLTATRDALIRVTRLPGTDAIEFYATVGSPEWSVVWRGGLGSQFARGEVTPPVPLDKAEFSELDALARDFVASWIWFSSSPEEEIAIERERYARHGFPVTDANVRSVN